VTRTLAIFAFALAGASAPGCGRKAEQGAAVDGLDPALATYIDRVAALAPKETAALEAVIAHSGTKYTDDQALLAAVRDTAVPRYREFVAALAAVTPPAGRVRELHARLQKLAADELALLERLQAALEHGDGTAVLFINRAHARAREEMDLLLGELRPASRPTTAARLAGSGQ
jgi:hypothetical protein